MLKQNDKSVENPLIHTRNLPPADAMKFAQQWAKDIHNSKLFKTANIEQASLIAWDCLYKKIVPTIWNQRYELMNGRITPKAERILAEFFEAGGEVSWIKRDAKIAKAVFNFRGRSEEVQFTIEDAQAAGLLDKKSPWHTYPDAMLRARLITKAMRFVAPEVIDGMYSEEEVLAFAETTLVEEVSTKNQSIPEPQNYDTITPNLELIPAITAQVVESQASVEQCNLIKDYAKKLDMPPDAIKGMIQKRGCEKLAELTSDQADEILINMQRKISENEKAEMNKDLNSWPDRVLGKA